MEKGDSTDSSNCSKRKALDSMRAMKKRQKSATPWPDETVEEKYPLGPPAQKADEFTLIPKKKRQNQKNRRAKELALSAKNKISREKQAESFKCGDDTSASKEESDAKFDEDA